MKHRYFFSEHGEDEWMLRSQVIPKCGCYVDVGCAHPFVNSNTAMLRQRPGWTGLAIDGDQRWGKYWRTPFMHRVLAANHDPVHWHMNEANPFRSRLSRGEDVDGEVLDIEVLQPSTLEDAILANRVERIDLLSIDVNGYESTVLNGFDWDRHQPSVLIVQYSRPDRVLESIAELGQYQLGATTASNFIYIRRK